MLHVPPPLMDKVSSHTAWTYNKQGGWSVIERGSRIRPERSNRRNVQKLTWRNSDWVKGFPKDMDSRVASMTIADVSPGVAIQRVIFLYDNFQYREAANFINRLNYSTFKAILAELPIDVFVDAVPHSLPVLEALYAKVFLSDGLNFTVKLLRPQGVVMQMVKLFAQHEDTQNSSSIPVELDVSHPYVSSCKKLLKVIVLSEPHTKKQLHGRKRALDKAIAGLGQHGMVGTSDDTLMNLHDALKMEFERVIHQYKIAVQKLDELSLAPKQPVARSLSHGPAPTKASHQRQLSLRQDEIQERLIKNKSLLNVIEPTLTNHSLEMLLNVLQKRIEFDKDVLFQFTQLRKEIKDVNLSSIVAPVLMRFSHGCKEVLDLMKEVADDDDDDSSDISGYHSDSDSAIVMMSGNSPYASGNRQYNIFNRSVKASTNTNSRTRYLLTLQFSSRNILCRSQASTKTNISTTSVNNSEVENLSDPWEVHSLRKEVDFLRSELSKARQTIAALEEREKTMKDRLTEQAQKLLDRGVRFEEVCLKENRPVALVRRYGNLYAQARVDTLDALDSLPELRDGDELKSKLLFSVVVLSFRSVQKTLLEIKASIRHILQIPELPSHDVNRESGDVELSINNYLRSSSDRFDLRKHVEEVCSQIWATLYDYPCLKNCEGLIEYVRDCIRLAWGLSTQAPPFVIDYESRVFRRDMHVRFHSSNQESNQVKTYLWPSLLEGINGPCVHKGVVVT
ncbi:uncharacterized protein LOC106465625 [Limulus polyphemus]|uniref:Mitochondria-eating protein n=1 Tax=Limulus polyphemus TaxID=6850 RepID=A0ABM1BG32_LIMPO|nr:uncharacterized protein LOC106465625 [Limulus polyphemus]